MGSTVVASFSPLPLEVRRVAWDRLWRILLAPPASPDPATEVESDTGSQTHRSGQQTDMRCGQ